MTAQKNKRSPLNGLIGVWKGDKGIDLAPKPEVDEKNPYYETIVFEAVDIDIENAGEQELLAVRYHQRVTEIESGDVSHDETGYWIWDKEEDTIMLTFSIPRGVCVLANGKAELVKAELNTFNIKVETDEMEPEKGIVQSKFMSMKANTSHFIREFILSDTTLSYKQVTTVDIYGKIFKHEDSNTLKRT